MTRTGGSNVSIQPDFTTPYNSRLAGILLKCVESLQLIEFCKDFYLEATFFASKHLRRILVTINISQS